MDNPSAAPVRQQPEVVFDGDCGFCTSSAGWLSRRLRRPGRPDVHLVPWQRSDLTALGVTAARAQHEVLWVDVDGTVLGGATAVAAWLRYAGRPWSLAGWVMTWPVIRQVAASTYRWVADHRASLPGGTPACALPQPRDERGEEPHHDGEALVRDNVRP